MKKTPKTTQPDLSPEISNLKASLARALADYANLERRFSEQSSSVVKFATANLLTKLLDLRDHLEMASGQIKDQSLNMILSSFDKLLQSEGVEVVKTEGQYDPTTMECQELSAGPKDQVVKVVRSGYRLHDRVLRTARVVVGSGTPAPAPAPQVSPAKETSEASV
ncbi:nucleotide exchange factor GrpE [Candidatus Woesebacteria bacterium]|nr:nucleotide exchange factor GrpE [Candidatus Woesebacteria bacterium]